MNLGISMANSNPYYAFEPLRRCLLSLINILKVLHLSTRGISILTNRQKMVERVIQLTVDCGKEVTPELKNDLRVAMLETEFAEEERKNDFPTVHANALVGTWGALEAGVEDMLVGIL